MKTSCITMFLLCAFIIRAFQAVDVNNATAEQIATLPGIGKRVAMNIVAERKRRHFSSVNDLSLIAGMTPRKLEQIKSHVIFGARGKLAKAKKSDKEEIKSPLTTNPIVDLPYLEEKVLLWQGLEEKRDHSMVARTRLAAWLPQLSTYIETDDRELALKKASDVQTRGGRNIGFGIKARFDLDKLIFNPDEIDVAKLALTRQEKRNEILTHIRKEYFRYLEIASTPLGEGDRELKERLLRELAYIRATLDGMSGGAFSAYEKLGVLS